MNLKKLLFIPLFAAAFFSFKPVDKPVIVIDAGHGGNDMGAVYETISEKQITLKVASLIKEMSTSQDKYEIMLTRGDDSDVSLAERIEKINRLNPKMVVSLHLNSSPEKESTKQGHEIYIQNSDSSKKIAQKVSEKLGQCPVQTKDLKILKESKSPAVLVEMGFINSTKDRDYLNSDLGQKETAQKFIEIFNEQ